MRTIFLAAICLVFCGSALAAKQDTLKVNGDKKYGKCLSSTILGDYFKRFPPVGSKFNLEIDIDRKSHEIYVYYYDMPKYDGETSYYDSKTCEYLRIEKSADSDGEE